MIAVMLMTAGKVWLVYILGILSGVIYLLAVQKPAKVSIIKLVAVFIVIIIVFNVIKYQLTMMSTSLGQPISIAQLQDGKIYVNETMPELDLMVISRCNQYPTEDLWTIKGIPEGVAKGSYLIVKDEKVINIF